MADWNVPRSVLLLLSLLAAAAFAGAQARNSLTVTQPKVLLDKLGSNGKIKEQPARFGIPLYGRSMRGQVVVPPGDSTGCSAFTERPKNPGGNPLVFLLSRGQCTFVTKVRNSEYAGATAVIIVNGDDGPIPQMDNDGSGSSLTIPSMMISQSDGKTIKDYLAEPKASAVEVSIEYGLPQSKIVDFTLWTSALDPQSAVFVESFSPIAKLIDETTNFQPRYHVINGTFYGCDTKDGICGNQCTNKGRYCAMDPDHDISSGSSGAKVVEENLRQMCIFDIARQAKKRSLWWEYRSAFSQECMLRKELGEDCFKRAVAKVPGLSVESIQKCVVDSGGFDGAMNKRLEEELKQRTQSGVYILPTVLVNDVTYFGSLSCPAPLDMAHCGVLSTICTAYVDGSKPSICSPSMGCQLGRTRDACDRCLPFNSPDFIADKKQCPVVTGGVSLAAVLSITAIFVVIFIIAAFAYHQHSSTQMRDELRNIMSQYVPLESENTPLVQQQGQPSVS